MDTIYLDNASTTFPKPACVPEAMLRYITGCGSNIARGGYSAAYSAKEMVFETRERICSLFGGEDSRCVVFTKNVTETSGAAGRKHEFCALEDAGHVLVLYQANDRELVEPCLDVLRKKNKKVQACVYVTGDPEADASCIPVHAKKDVNVWQVPSDVVLERFKTVKADILIDLTRPDCYPMQYLMLQHPCRFKVGVKHADIDLYDLSISVTEREDIKHLFEHILFYLQAIRSK